MPAGPFSHVLPTLVRLHLTLNFATAVADACGLAGGTPWLPEVGEAGDYTKTVYAHHGTNGSTLPPMDTGVKWTIGKYAEVTWQVRWYHATPRGAVDGRGRQQSLGHPTGRQQSALTSTRVTYGTHFMQVLNNHGGGYSYRLCPAGEKLTEECFQKHPQEIHHILL